MKTLKEHEILGNEEASKSLLTKKQLYCLLYNEIEKYYIDYHSNAFELLNSQDMKDSIINEICNNDNLENLTYLKQQYFKINKNLFNEYKNYTYEEEQKQSKFNINWDFIFQLIFNIIMFPITILIGSAFTYERYNRKRKRGR